MSLLDRTAAVDVAINSETNEIGFFCQLNKLLFTRNTFEFLSASLHQVVKNTYYVETMFLSRVRSATCCYDSRSTGLLLFSSLWAFPHKHWKGANRRNAEKALWAVWRALDIFPEASLDEEEAAQRLSTPSATHLFNPFTPAAQRADPTQRRPRSRRRGHVTISPLCSSH